jgi:hypothetical protein
MTLVPWVASDLVSSQSILESKYTKRILKVGVGGTSTIEYYLRWLLLITNEI